MERIILHSDCNSFYASVECLYHPEIRRKPVVVGGDIEQRHGIILAKTQLAKQFHVSTGEAIWQAKQKCPELIVLPPNFPLYLRFSRLARDIYLDYSNRVEPFGLDEAWLDITSSENQKDKGEKTAQEIRKRIREELGITVSIGVSYNKIFAKRLSKTRCCDHDYQRELPSDCLAAASVRFAICGAGHQTKIEWIRCSYHRRACSNAS